MRISLFLALVFTLVIASCSTNHKQTPQTEKQASTATVSKKEEAVINIEQYSDPKEENLFPEKPTKKKNTKMTYYKAKKLCASGHKKSDETIKTCIKRLLNKNTSKSE